MHTPLAQAFARPWPTTRRGLKLWLISIVLGLKGMGYVLGNIPPTTEYALRVLTEGRIHIWGLHLWIPLWVIAWGLVLACAFSALTSYCHIGRDRWGYAALQGFCSLWTTLYLIALFYFDAPRDVAQGMLTWVTIGLILAACAGDAPGECTLHEDGSLIPSGRLHVLALPPVLLTLWAIDGTWFASAALALVLGVIAISPTLYTIRTSRRADRTAQETKAEVDAVKARTASRADLQAASEQWQRLYDVEHKDNERLEAKVEKLTKEVVSLRTEAAELRAEVARLKRAVP